jgi:protoporphyrinogen IX oxidase
MHPAMLLTILLGILLITLNPSVMRAPWFHVKLLAVAGLIAYQIFAGIVAKRFARGDFFLSERACRFINEIPTLLLFIIVIMVVVKPWS